MRPGRTAAALLVATCMLPRTLLADPFDPARTAARATGNPLAQALSLARIPPEQWRLIGTIRQGQRMTALIEDPERRVHLLEAGQHIGGEGLEVRSVGSSDLLLRDARPGRQEKMIHLRLEPP